MTVIEERTRPVLANEMDTRRADERTNRSYSEAFRGGDALALHYPTTMRSNEPVVNSSVVTGITPLRAVRTRSPQSERVYLFAKRVLDVIVASLVLLLLSPLYLLVAAIIWSEDKGCIFYCQTRVGKDGKPFRFYKFRSMVMNADALKQQLAAHNEASGPIFKMKNDPRITRIGRVIRRYSIDELPQMWNVLRGDMSLVGPRPHLPSEVARYTERHQKRLSVQPGLLCLREVQGRSNLTFERWIETDLMYVEHRCFLTDLKILLQTIPAVLRADGAY